MLLKLVYVYAHDKGKYKTEASVLEVEMGTKADHT